MSARSSLLWAAFLAAHLLTAVTGWLLPNQPMGDVVLVYQPWARAALEGGPIMGITDSWVYPQLALLPMLLAQGLATPLVALIGDAGGYLVGWALLVTLCDALGMAVLLGRRPSRRRVAAGWFWAAALVLLGPVAMYRIDAVTVPVAVAAGAMLGARPRLAAGLLTIGAWIKIWPGAVLMAAVIAMRNRVQLIVAAVAVSGAIAATLLVLGAQGRLLGFLGEQTARGLQIEAVAATPLMWAAMSGEASVEYSFDILTYQVAAPSAHTLASAMTPLMIVLVGVIVLLGALRVRAGAEATRVLPALALALVTALIVANKVGSPQFTTWLIAPAILWLVADRFRARTPAALVLLLCALTFCVYPLTYDGLLAAQLAPVLLLTLRNLLLVVLLCVAVRAVVIAPTAAPPVPVTAPEAAEEPR